MPAVAQVSNTPPKHRRTAAHTRTYFPFPSSPLFPLLLLLSSTPPLLFLLVASPARFSYMSTSQELILFCKHRVQSHRSCRRPPRVLFNLRLIPKSRLERQVNKSWCSYHGAPRHPAENERLATFEDNHYNKCHCQRFDTGEDVIGPPLATTTRQRITDFEDNQCQSCFSHCYDEQGKPKMLPLSRWRVQNRRQLRAWRLRQTVKTDMAGQDHTSALDRKPHTTLHLKTSRNTFGNEGCKD